MNMNSRLCLQWGRPKFTGNCTGPTLLSGRGPVQWANQAYFSRYGVSFAESAEIAKTIHGSTWEQFSTVPPPFDPQTNTTLKWLGGGICNGTMGVFRISRLSQCGKWCQENHECTGYVHRDYGGGLCFHFSGKPVRLIKWYVNVHREYARYYKPQVEAIAKKTGVSYEMVSHYFRLGTGRIACVAKMEKTSAYIYIQNEDFRCLAAAGNDTLGLEVCAEDGRQKWLHDEKSHLMNMETGKCVTFPRDNVTGVYHRFLLMNCSSRFKFQFKIGKTWFWGYQQVLLRNYTRSHTVLFKHCPDNMYQTACRYQPLEWERSNRNEVSHPGCKHRGGRCNERITKWLMSVHVPGTPVPTPHPPPPTPVPTPLDFLIVSNISGACVQVYLSEYTWSNGKPSAIILKLGGNIEYCRSGSRKSNNWVVDSRGRIEMTSKNRYKVPYGKRGLCVDIFPPISIHGRFLKGRRLTLKTCNNAKSQQFTRIAADPDGKLSGSFFKNLETGTCLDVKGRPGIRPGTEMLLWACEFKNPKTDQIFQMVPWPW